MDIVKQNTAIASFMEVPMPEGYSPERINYFNGNHIYIPVNYHSSWNDLMPAWSKLNIKVKEYMHESLKLTPTLIKKVMLIKELFLKATTLNEIDFCYIQLVELLKWYNQRP